MLPRAVVAVDHRAVFERMTAAAGVRPPATHGTIAQLKFSVFAAVQRVLRGDAGHDADLALLLDEQYAGSLVLRARQLGMTVALAIERNEAARFTLEYGDDWAHHLADYRPDFAKVLFRWGEDGDPAHEAAVDRLVDVAGRCRGHGQRMLLELLPRDGDTAALPHEVCRLVERGVTPALWKIPVPHTRDEAGAVVAATRAAGGPVPGVLLLGGAGHRTDTMQAMAACLEVDGVTGWAVGRAIWAQPLTDLLAGSVTQAQAVDAMAGQLRMFLDLLPRPPAVATEAAADRGR